MSASLVDITGIDPEQLKITDWSIFGTEEIFKIFKQNVLQHTYGINGEQFKDPFPYLYCIPMIRKIKERRGLSGEPGKEFFMDNLCIPGGTSKLFVSADGKFYVCERVDGNDNMIIGDVWNGVDKKKSYDLIQDFYNKIGNQCERCWLIQFCDTCFSHVIENGAYDLKKQIRHCQMQRAIFHDMFQFYYSILEQDKTAFCFLEEMNDKKDAVSLNETK